MEPVYRQFIAGEWVAASNGKTWDLLDPSTEGRIVEVPYGNATDCRAAIEAAQKAFTNWSRETPYVRAAILKRGADLIRATAKDLARVTVLESGKPFVQSELEWLAAAELLDWFAEEGKRAYGRTIPSRKADKRMMVIKQPLGVVGIITAWNFPIYNPARATAAALAAGCTVVLRPSEYTPLSGMLLAQILQQAGIPSGVFNLISGDPESMGQELLRHPAVRKIHLTGSPRVGQILQDGASKTVKRLSLELGGNAPVIVLPDVDIAALAASSVVSKYRNGGQVCISPQRFLVHKKVEAQFTESVAAQTKNLKLGSGLEPDTQVGPLINSKQRDHVSALVDEARKGGVHLQCGGKRPDQFKKGYFYEPTVLSGVTPQMRVFTDEIFGPVLPITPFEELEQAIELANQTPYGLAAYVWTNNLKAATLAYERLEFGIVGVNEWVPHAIEAPFGGWKQSGLGHECGSEGLEEYLEKKLVSFGGIDH